MRLSITILAALLLGLSASSALAADPPHDRCSDSLTAIEMRDADGLRAYSRFIESDMAALNQLARSAGTGGVDFADPRWGTPSIRGQQVANDCRRAPAEPFPDAVLHIYHGYRVASGLPPILPARQR